MTDSGKTIGVLYPGELGTAVASALRSRGCRIVTTLAGRGAATAARSAAAGVVALESLGEVVAQAEVVMSLVPPSAAEGIAGQYCELARLAPKGALYVDVNSIGPELARSIGAKVIGAGCGFVDGAINGLAKNLATSGTLFLSGERADEVAQLFGDAMRVRVLGAEIGRASAMKMLLSGLSKGVCALFLELALVAERDGMLAEMLDATGLIYPGILGLAERMLPTYTLHAARRATEMQELDATVRAGGVEPVVTEAVRRLHESLAAASPEGARGMKEWMERLAASGFLKD